MAEKVEKDPRIHLMTQTEIESVEGFVGNFKTKLRTGKELQEIDHGVIVVATGAEEYRPEGIPLRSGFACDHAEGDGREDLPSPCVSQVFSEEYSNDPVCRFEE